MSIKKQLDELFAQWRQAQIDAFGEDHTRFFEDGLVGSEEEYMGATKKVLYVLTEAE